jgi:hypothetical protein
MTHKEAESTFMTCFYYQSGSRATVTEKRVLQRSEGRIGESNCENVLWFWIRTRLLGLEGMALDSIHPTQHCQTIGPYRSSESLQAGLLLSSRHWTLLIDGDVFVKLHSSSSRSHDSRYSPKTEKTTCPRKDQYFAVVVFLDCLLHHKAVRSWRRSFY